MLNTDADINVLFLSNNYGYSFSLYSKINTFQGDLFFCRGVDTLLMTVFLRKPSVVTSFA